MKKKTLSDSEKKIDGNHIHFVMQSRIRVYPVYASGWYIEVLNNGKITRFDKKVNQSDLNEAIAKTILFYYNKLKTKENE